MDAALGEWVAVFILGPGITFLDFGDESIENIERLDFGENGGAGITRALSTVPNLEIFGEIDLGLALFSFGFLEADDVWLLGIDEVEESAFFQAGAKAVDVPRIDFDILFSIFHVQDPVF